MGQTRKKRFSASEDSSDSKRKKVPNDEENEDVSSDMENEKNENEAAKSDRSDDQHPNDNEKECQQSNETPAVDGSEDKDEQVAEGSEPTPPTSAVKKAMQIREKRKGKRRVKSEKIEVKAIISHKTSQSEKKSRKYKVALKNGLNMWMSGQMAIFHCQDLIHQYLDDLKNEVNVEAILSHKKEKGRTIKYLIKWKDRAKGETWEGANKALDNCPNMLKTYIEKVEKADAKAYVVTAIVDHKTFHGKSKYLVKWKDKSKGETWESAKRTIALCPDVLDKFLLAHPDCLPRMHVPLHKQRTFRYKKIESADDESDATVEEYEVERILDVRFAKDNTREFFIRWKGYRSAYDSWQRERDLNCPDLIEKLMLTPGTPKKAANQKRARKLRDKVEGTRSSKRHDGRQRPTYVDVANVSDDDDDDD